MKPSTYPRQNIPAQRLSPTAPTRRREARPVTRVQAARLRRSAQWLLLALLLLLGLAGCPSDEQVCPPPVTVGNLTPEEQQNLKCCEALRLCCSELKAGEDKDKCKEIVGGGAVVTCQAEYHTQVSFENCKPIYSRDHPELAPSKEKASSNDASAKEGKVE